MATDRQRDIHSQIRALQQKASTIFVAVNELELVSASEIARAERQQQQQQQYNSVAPGGDTTEQQLNKLVCTLQQLEVESTRLQRLVSERRRSETQLQSLEEHVSRIQHTTDTTLHLLLGNHPQINNSRHHHHNNRPGQLFRHAAAAAAAAEFPVATSRHFLEQQEKATAMACSHCGKRFEHTFALNRHLRTVHPKKEDAAASSSSSCFSNLLASGRPSPTAAHIAAHTPTAVDAHTPVVVQSCSSSSSSSSIDGSSNTEVAYVIYTDGSCKRNPGPGGWGFAARPSTSATAAAAGAAAVGAACASVEDAVEFVAQVWGGTPETTNNRMELQAIIEALLWARTHQAARRIASVVVRTDSEYCKNGITKWINKWKTNNWRTSDGQSVKNKDLWARLDGELTSATDEQGISVAFEWVKGHSGDKGNELADELSNHYYKHVFRRSHHP